MKKLLKKLILALCILSSIFVVGCKDEIVGVWKIKEYQITCEGQSFVYTQAQVEALTYSEDLPDSATPRQKVENYLAQLHSVYGEGKMEFTEKGELDIYVADAVSHNTYKREGSKITMITETPSGEVETEYTYQDNQIFIESAGNGMEIKLIYIKAEK